MPVSFLALATWVALLSSSSPEPFRPITHGRYPPGYYAEQAEEWSRRTRTACAVDSDWLQFYFFARYANRFGGAAYDLAGIARDAARASDPDGFTQAYIRYVQEPDLTTRYDYLKAAYAADSFNVYAQSSMLAYAKISGDAALAVRASRRINQQTPYPTGLTDYAYNTLESVSPGGILLTFGDADTYPIWVLQEDLNRRPDVLVANYYLLLRFPGYARLIFEELGLDPSPPADENALISRLRSSTRPLHLALTAGEALTTIRSDSPDVYPVGLTFQLSETPVTDNGYTTGRLYRDVWRLDAARDPLGSNPATRAGDQFAPNYLIPLLALRDKVDPGVDSLIQSIARRHELTAEVARLLAPTPPEPELASTDPGVSFRNLELRYRNGNLPRNRRTRTNRFAGPLDFYMAATEVTNGDYQLFLEDLLRQRKFDYLDTAAIAPSGWRALLGDSVAEVPDTELFAMGHPESDIHPVVNISHRAAELYAVWLTQAYNQDSKRKDERTVRFRLPTAVEFERAARGGRTNAPYPWGGPYYYNSKGCILANMNTALLGDSYPEGDFSGIAGNSGRSSRPDLGCKLDGSYLTAPVEAYYPNDFGLYNMSGNAAEMTDVDGQTMGGSWLDGPGVLVNGVITERQLPSPSTGFRLVMEYVGE